MTTENALDFLVVEDNPLSNQLICNQLEDLGHRVVGRAFDGVEAVAEAERLAPDVVLVDLQMPDPETGQDDARAGIKAARAIQERWPTPVVVLTAYESDALTREATAAGVGAYLLKPPDAREIERAARVALARFDDAQALHRLNRRLEAEIAARAKAEALLDATGQMARVGGWQLDAETQEVRWTAQTRRIHEVPPDYKPDLETAVTFFSPEDREKLGQAIERALDSGEPYDLEVGFITATGRHLWVRTVCHPEVVGGKTVRLRGIFQDITARKKAQDAMRDSLEKFRVLFDAFPLGITIADADGQILQSNAESERLLGISQAEHESRAIDGEAWRIIRPDGTPMPPDEYASVRALREQQPVQNAEMGIVKPSGEITWINVTAAPLQDDRVVITYNDITARKRAEAALRESENRFRRLFETMTEGVVLNEVIYDERGEAINYRSIGANPAYARHTGLPVESVVGKLATEAYGTDEPPYLDSHYAEVAATGTPTSFETYFPPMDRHFSISVFSPGPGQFTTVFEDITERKQTQEQLREYATQLEQMVEEKMRELEVERDKAVQMDKLAALGEMAASIAHELKQPLSAIGLDAGYLQNVAARAREKHAGDLNVLLDAEELGQIGKSLEGDFDRARRIIDHLRDFGRISQEPPCLVDLNQAIENSFILVGQRLREDNVEVRLDLDDDLPLILADPYKLEQVFINLINNAEHALNVQAGEVPGCQKVLDITTRAEGDTVIAVVRDTGCGIPEEIRARIFDPFFTTKPRGAGTGLGLSISYNIVAEFDGEIACESAPGEGTTFTLRFPAAE